MSVHCQVGEFTVEPIWTDIEKEEHGNIVRTKALDLLVCLAQRPGDPSSPGGTSRAVWPTPM